MKDKAKEEAIALVMAPFERAMSKIGIGPEYLAKKLKAELEAKEIKTFKASNKNFDEEGKLLSIDEKVIYSSPLVAWDVRQKGRMDAHKLRGDYPAEEFEHHIPGLENLAERLNEAIQKSKGAPTDKEASRAKDESGPGRATSGKSGIRAKGARK